MTTEEFKKLKPDCAHLEGNDLWDAMTEYMLVLKSGESVIKSAQPFFKRYRLRWLFYRRLPNFILSSGDYKSATRCAVCKRGTGMNMFFMGKVLCGYGDHEYKEEPNTSIKHRLYKFWCSVSKTFWRILDSIHLVRSSHEGRYDMFGDESSYVRVYTLNMETGKSKYELKRRKWWEYIFIKR
jgi:hypothetical protein